MKQGKLTRSVAKRSTAIVVRAEVHDQQQQQQLVFNVCPTSPVNIGHRKRKPAKKVSPTPDSAAVYECTGITYGTNDVASEQ